MRKRQLKELMQQVERVRRNGCKFPAGIQQRTKKQLRDLAEALLEVRAGVNVYDTIHNAFFFEQRKAA